MNADLQRAGDAFLRLQDWYASQCNGDWEHTFGITIDTLDNPGWIIAIDLAETPWEPMARPLVRIDRSESDWFQFEFVDKKFKGCGGIHNLVEVLEAFLNGLDDANSRSSKF